ncbi:hypothetical protein RFI_16109 [Reticulomyxa filosa]|uniref:Uncharacterized protein n=1 Tax=Reticulomyxa filosa TaxID=46433 RepID=X6N4Y2_RETFI|nr:hypothetical protein RFI_16109 [Reticulomyxa filosa]|eukprot:ETO21096.1 hypothetical protein RFI_16109 [Reticulomyxa filosa]
MAEEPGKEEIKIFLKVLRTQYVDKILEQLFDVLECDDMESVVVLPDEKWRGIFKEVGLSEGQQPKLLNALNEWRRKKNLEPLDVNAFMRGGTEKPQLKKNRVALLVHFQPSKPVEANPESSKEPTKPNIQNNEEIKEEKPKCGTEPFPKDSEKAKEPSLKDDEKAKEPSLNDENTKEPPLKDDENAQEHLPKDEKPKEPVPKQVEHEEQPTPTKSESKSKPDQNILNSKKNTTDEDVKDGVNPTKKKENMSTEKSKKK